MATCFSASSARLLTAFTKEVGEYCRRRGITYLLLPSNVNVEDVLLRTLRQAGILV